jgi:hypothetical protein
MTHIHTPEALRLASLITGEDCDLDASMLSLRQRPTRKARASRMDAVALCKSRAAAGLVSVSTSSMGLPFPVQWAENCITIDKSQARITRLRKGVGVGAKALHNAGPLGQSMYMVTLTYKGTNQNWEPKHISEFLKTMRVWYHSRTASRSLRYCWVAELQERGVIHYHCVFWLPKGIKPPYADRPYKLKGKGTQPPMWPHGSSNRLLAHAPVAYLMKYLSKIGQKNVGHFPRGARIFGLGGLTENGRNCKRWVLWPSYVPGNASASDNVRPSPGGGYVNRDTGELFLSEFVPTGGGFTSFMRVRHTPRKIANPVGPFSWLN